MSSLSYFSSNPAPMVMEWSGLVSSTPTFLDSYAAWKVAVCCGLATVGIPS